VEVREGRLVREGEDADPESKLLRQFEKKNNNNLIKYWVNSSNRIKT